MVDLIFLMTLVDIAEQDFHPLLGLLEAERIHRLQTVAFATHGFQGASVFPCEDFKLFHIPLDRALRELKHLRQLVGF